MLRKTPPRDCFVRLFRETASGDTSVKTASRHLREDCFVRPFETASGDTPNHPNKHREDCFVRPFRETASGDTSVKIAS
ncbi:hypothetical protein J6590_008590 [Homalodisca vitripennis]|nr:hypothetical protein J6590_008590 [Homalodisca vitripennis]